MWTDIEFGCVPTDERLRQAFAVGFGVPIQAVVIADDILAADPWADPTVRIVLERNQQPGDFPLHVMVILGDDELRERVAGWDEGLGMVQRLCEELDCRALISDDDPDPYRWILVSPKTVPRIVEVDPAQLDNADALVLLNDMASRRVA